MRALDGYTIGSQTNAYVAVTHTGARTFVETTAVQGDLLSHTTVKSGSNSLATTFVIDAATFTEIQRLGLKVQYTLEDPTTVTTLTFSD